MIMTHPRIPKIYAVSVKSTVNLGGSGFRVLGGFAVIRMLAIMSKPRQTNADARTPQAKPTLGFVMSLFSMIGKMMPPTDDPLIT